MKKEVLFIVSLLLCVSGCSTNNNEISQVTTNPEKEVNQIAINSPKGKGTLIAYYPHSGSLLQGFTWFQPLIVNGKTAGNIQPNKHIVCYLAAGSYTVSTTSGGFGLPNNLRQQAKKNFTVVAGKTTYVKFNFQMGAHRSSVQIVPGSKTNASTTKLAGNCKI
ncbi:MAG: DUF2846 domain-containing protein [Rhizobiales bacterium]|nr:DUF2846 domain-containing protein [Hyphomicrobiales bacterium]